jgi:hypothetical protein
MQFENLLALSVKEDDFMLGEIGESHDCGN